MSKFFYLTKNRNHRPRQKRRWLSLMKINIKTTNMIIGLLIVVFSVSYLVQINGLATKGYQIKELEKRITELEEQKSDLELVTLSLQSMGSVKDKVVDLGMVEVGEPDYLNLTPVAVAR